MNLQFATVGNSLIITFDDPFMATAAGLIDGRYTLTVVADNIVADGGFDGNGDGSPGDNGVRTFHRLFGDANGDATVNATDFLAFRLAFLSSDPAFDYNGNGTVDSSDFMQFRLRFLQSV